MILAGLVAVLGITCANAQVDKVGKPVVAKDKSAAATTHKKDPHVAKPGDVRVNNTNAAKPVYKPAYKVKNGKMQAKQGAATMGVKPSPRPMAAPTDKGRGHHGKGHGRKGHHKDDGRHHEVPKTAKHCNG